MVNLGCCGVPMACLFRFGGPNANGIFKLLCQLYGIFGCLWRLYVNKCFRLGCEVFPRLGVGVSIVLGGGGGGLRGSR